MRPIKVNDIVGHSFGYYFVKQYLGLRNVNRRIYHYYKVICVCGTEKEARRSSLISGACKSCGCAGKGRTPITSRKNREVHIPIEELPKTIPILEFFALLRERTQERIEYFEKQDYSLLSKVEKNTLELNRDLYELVKDYA